MEMTVQEAALHLNVSVNTIRRKLSIGAISGTKVGARWMLTIDDQAPGGKAGVENDQQSEIKWLREQLETRTREISELHQLLTAYSLNPDQSKPWWAFWR